MAEYVSTVEKDEKRAAAEGSVSAAWRLGAWVWAAAAGMLLAMPALVLSSPSVWISHNAQDFVFAMDSGWRSLQGQAPHVDFHTPIGVLYYVVEGLGARFGGPGPTGVAAADAVALLLLLPLAAAVASKRLPTAMACVFLLAACSISASPRGPDYEFAHASFLAAYNRWAWTLLTVCMLGFLAEPAPSKKEGSPQTRNALSRAWRRHGDAFLLACASTALLHVKATAFAALCACAAAAWFLSPRNHKAILAAVAAPFATLLPEGVLWCLFDGQSGYLHDLWATASISGLRPGRLSLVYGASIENSILVLAACALAAAAGRTRGDLRRAGGAIAAGACGIACSFQNHELADPGLWLACVLAWGALDGARAGTGAPAALLRRRAFRVLAALALSAPALSASATDFASAVHSALASRDAASIRYSEDPSSPLSRLSTKTNGFPDIAALALLGEPIPGGTQGAFLPLHTQAYATWIAAGEELLQGRDVRGRVLSLAFSNPFPVAGLRPSPSGDLSWWHSGRTFDASVHPDPKTLMAGADAILVPAFGLENATVRAMREIYCPELERTFVPTASNGLWSLWERVPASDRRIPSFPCLPHAGRDGG